MSQVGEATISLKFDTKTLSAGMKTADNEVSRFAKDSANKLDKWSVATGSLIAKGISSAASAITSSLDSAISRVDTLNNFPKVMSNLGIGADDAQKSIDKLSEAIDGLPTALDDAAGSVQYFTSSNGDISKSTDYFIALNNAILAGGQSADVQSTALMQLSQSYAKGKPDMVEWRSAMTAMPAQLKQVAQAMGYANADALGESLRNGEVSMEDFMKTLVTLNKDGVGDFQSFEEQARNSTNGIGTAMQNVRNRISKAIGEIINAIGQENIANAINAISSGFINIGKAIGGVVTFISQNMWILTALAGAIAPLMAYGIATKIFALTSALNPLNLKIMAVVAICATLAGAAKWIQDNWSGITEFFGNIFSSLGQAAQGAWNVITGIFGNLAGFFGSIFTAAWTNVKNVFSTGGQIFMGIVDGILSAFKAIVNTIIRGINTVVAIPFNGINGFLSFLRGINILGVTPFGWVQNISVPQIPYLATGGIVPNTKGGRMIVAGEGGEDEWVVPESKMASLISQINAGLDQQTETAGAGRSITVNMYNNIASGLDADEIGQRMLTSIRRTTL